MPALHETAYPYLKRQPSAQDLARIYTPTRAERDLAARQTKGPVVRIGFLAILKTFQRLGHFTRLANVPEPIVAHIIAYIGVPLTVADLGGYDTSGTRLRHLTASRWYRAYGAKRSGNDFAFERTYTGQHLDDTGLLYYGARYYDPAAGRFISPDTLVPDPSDPLNYNRYLYSRGNPVKDNDPSGPCAVSAIAQTPGAAAIDAACWVVVETAGLHLQLELSEEKTLVTHATTEAARCLGYEVRVVANSGNRMLDGSIMLRVPRDVRTKWTTKYLAKGKTDVEAQGLVQCYCLGDLMGYGTFRNSGSSTSSGSKGA